MKPAPDAAKAVLLWYVIFAIWYPFLSFYYSQEYDLGYWRYPAVKYAIALLLFGFAVVMTWAAMTFGKENPPAQKTEPLDDLLNEIEMARQPIGRQPPPASPVEPLG